MKGLLLLVIIGIAMIFQSHTIYKMSQVIEARKLRQEIISLTILQRIQEVERKLRFNM